MQLSKEASMPREIKNIEDYRKASNESFASVMRSFSEVNRSLTEFSKASFSRVIEMQAQLAKKAYESYLSEASKLGQMFLAGYGRFGSRTEERPEVSVTDRSGSNKSATQRTAAHRVATERKTGAAKRRSRAKRSAKARR
jgi:hypothetical protein